MTIKNNTKSSANITIGSLLTKAREDLGLTHEIIAEKLCLKISTIKEIEQDIKPDGVEPTFLRGYIRLYARFVGIPKHDIEKFLKIKENFNTINELEEKITCLTNKKYKIYELWLIKIIFIVAIILISLISVGLFCNYRVKNNKSISIINLNKSAASYKKINLDSSELLNPLIQVMFSIGNTDLKDTPVFFKKKIINSDLSIVSKKAQKLKLIDEPKKIPNVLIIDFFGLCWLEVSDVNKKILFSGTKNIGDKLELYGEKYYNLNIGAPANVSVNFKGKTVNFNNFVKNNSPIKIHLS